MSAEDNHEILAQMQRIETALSKRLERIEDKVDRQGEASTVAREGISSLRAVNASVSAIMGAITGAVASALARKL